MRSAYITWSAGHEAPALFRRHDRHGISARVRESRQTSTVPHRCAPIPDRSGSPGTSRCDHFRGQYSCRQSHLTNPDQGVSAILSGSDVPVYILPGRTDPYTPDSPFRLQPALFKTPVHVFTDARSVNLRNSTVALYPYPVRSRDHGAWLPPDDWIP